MTSKIVKNQLLWIHSYFRNSFWIQVFWVDFELQIIKPFSFLNLKYFLTFSLKVQQGKLAAQFLHLHVLTALGTWLLCFTWMHANAWGPNKAIFLEMQRGWMTRNIRRKNNWLAVSFGIWIKLNIWLNRFICKDTEQIFLYPRQEPLGQVHWHSVYHAHSHYCLSIRKDTEVVHSTIQNIYA